MPTTHQLRRTLSSAVAGTLAAVLPLTLGACPAIAETSPAPKSTVPVTSLTEKRKVANVLTDRVDPRMRGVRAPSVSVSGIASVDGYSTIAGTVTDPDGNPVEGASVWAYSRSAEDWLEEATTDADGAYLLDELDADTYTLEFDSPIGSPLAGEWWNNRTSPTSATYFHLSSGQDVDGKDAELGLGGTVTGTVTDSDGVPVEGAEVLAADTHARYGVSAADGSYSIVGVAPGRQTLEFSGPEDSTLADEWWNDQPYYAKAEFFTVTSEGTVTGKDASLDEGGSIDGEVYDYWLEEGAYEVPVYVLAYDRGWHYVNDVETDDEGSFGVENLRPGLAYAVLPDDWGVTTDATADGVGLIFIGSNGKPRTVVNPKLSGLPEVGSSLSLKRGSGKWSGVRSSYVWLADDEEIDGANRATYRLTHDDLHTSLRAQVTADWNGDTMTASTLPTGGVVLAATPHVVGDLQVGGDVRVETGVWTDGTEFAYQWYADGKPLPEASDAGLVVPAGAAGRRLTVRVTGSLADHATLSKTSPATPRVMLAAVPRITGAQAVGFALGIDRGAWTSRTSFTYQWLRDGEPIAKATRSTYKVTPEDAGTELTVRVTGRRSSYSTTVRQSEAGGVVTTASVPSVGGSAAVGAALTADPGDWADGTLFAYQWYADGNPIDTATEATYQVGTAVAGKRLSVTVTGTLVDCATVALSSARTARVILAGVPAITGDATVGSRLSVNPGTWTAKTRLSYQWLRDGAPIKGATGSAYAVAGLDAGHAIAVVVTGKRSGYTTVAATSEPVAVP